MIFEESLRTMPIAMHGVTSSFVPALFVLSVLTLIIFIFLISRVSYNRGRYEALKRYHEDYVKAEDRIKDILEEECHYWRHINNPKSFKATNNTTIDARSSLLKDVKWDSFE